MRRQLAALVLTLLLVLAGWQVAGRPRPFGNDAPEANVPGLTDLTSVDQLRARFDADAGFVRLVLILSPT